MSGRIIASRLGRSVVYGPDAVLDRDRIDGSAASHAHEAIDQAVTRYVGAFEAYALRLSD